MLSSSAVAPASGIRADATIPAGVAADACLPRTLVLTGHFPPQHGGVQRFTAEFIRRLPARQLAVLAPDRPGGRNVDAGLPFPVRRFRGHVMVNPLLARHLADAIRAHRPDVVWVTSGFPLGLVAGIARRAGVERVVVSTHGLESGLLRLPHGRHLLRAALAGADVVTALGEHTAAAIAPTLSPRQALRTLHGGVDSDRYRPDADAAEAIDRWHLHDRPYVVTVGRLVPRKGQDVLLRAWPGVLRRHPDAVAVLIGEGYLERRLRAMARSLDVERSVVFAGAVPDHLLPGCLAGASAYALPCRDRLGGLVLEGLGLATLEASASGLPVVVGDSGGASDAVIDGVTGHLLATGPGVPDRGVTALRDRLVALLDDPAQARHMGQAGRRWVQRHWGWDRMTTGLVELLAEPVVSTV